jgi:HlyD family secretion protein
MFRKRLFWIVALALVLAVAGGGGYYYYRNAHLQAQAATEDLTVTTSLVKRGDLLLTADGSGTLMPAKELSVGFGSGGTLTEMLVKVGDKVQAGQALARIDDTDAQTQVQEAEISLRQAEISLAALTDKADPAELAAAQASVSSAKAALTTLTSPASKQEVLAAQQTLKGAKEALADLLALPDADTVASAKADLTLAEMALHTAQAAYDQVASQPNVGMTSQATALWSATTEYEKAQATYNESLKGATADELSDARAQIAQAQAALDDLNAAPDPDALAAAQAQVTQTEAALNSLLAGTPASDLETAQLNVDQAKLALASAQRALAQTELTAPIAGTVIAAGAQPGEAVGTSTIITLADLDQPLIEFWVEESDMTSVAPGNAINVTFDALPDTPYTGKILSIDPALVTVDSTSAVQVWASLDSSTQPTTLLSGMNATVEVVSGEARNALLVPVEALREISPGKYGVMVVNSDGTMELRQVEVGLKDLVTAEITSGLTEGETVSLSNGSAAQTTTSTSTSSQQNEGMPAGGPMFFDGGGRP